MGRPLAEDVGGSSTPFGQLCSINEFPPLLRNFNSNPLDTSLTDPAHCPTLRVSKVSIIMSVNVLTVAEFAASQSGWAKSNLELQKIVYLAHMIHSGVYGRPLVKGDFQAWDLGPVHPVLYHRVKRFGAGRVESISHRERNPIGNEGLEILKECIDVLSKKSGGQLISITHWGKGAWARNYQSGVRHRRIPQEHIEDEYRERIKRQRDS